MAELETPAETRDQLYERAFRRWEALIRATARSYVIPGRLEEDDLVQEACIALNEVITDQVLRLKWWSVDSEHFGKYFKTKLYHTWTDSVRFERSARRNPNCEVRSLEDSEDDPIDSLHSRELTPEERFSASQFARRIRSRLEVLSTKLNQDGSVQNPEFVRDSLMTFDLYIGSALPEYELSSEMSAKLDELMEFVRACPYCRGRGKVFDDCCTCMDHASQISTRKVKQDVKQDVPCEWCRQFEDCCTCADRRTGEPTHKVQVVVGQEDLECPVCTCRCKGTGKNPNPSKVTQTQIQDFLNLKRVRGTEIFWQIKQAAKSVDAPTEDTCHAFLHVFGYPDITSDGQERPFLIASCNLKDGTPYYAIPTYSALKSVMTNEEVKVLDVFHTGFNGVRTSVKMQELARKLNMAVEDLRRVMDAIRWKLEMIECGVPLKDITLYV